MGEIHPRGGDPTEGQLDLDPALVFHPASTPTLVLVLVSTLVFSLDPALVSKLSASQVGPSLVRSLDHGHGTNSRDGAFGEGWSRHR